MPTKREDSGLAVFDRTKVFIFGGKHDGNDRCSFSYTFDLEDRDKGFENNTALMPEPLTEPGYAVFT